MEILGIVLVVLVVLLVIGILSREGAIEGNAERHHGHV